MVRRAVASDFEILPAIDLRGGRVVRLRQGDFERETVYSDDPPRVAQAFADAGAGWLHVVDLDGARTGTPTHTAVIRAMVDAVDDRLAIEVAGGLRTEAAVDAALAAGAARVVVGTAVLRDPAFAGRLAERHGDRIVVALDVRGGMALGQGWRAGAEGLGAEEALQVLADQGITTFEATAIDRDGLLEGPDLDLLGGMARLGRGRLLASGGIATLDHLRAVRAIGCSGAIVGRALYEGRLDLADALSVAGEPARSR